MQLIAKGLRPLFFLYLNAGTTPSPLRIAAGDNHPRDA